MRARRDPFARVTFRPVKLAPIVTATGLHVGCTWCGQPPAPRRPLYEIRAEHDGGRKSWLAGRFESWECVESFNNGAKVGR